MRKEIRCLTLRRILLIRELLICRTKAQYKQHINIQKRGWTLVLTSFLKNLEFWVKSRIVSLRQSWNKYYKLVALTNLCRQCMESFFAYFFYKKSQWAGVDSNYRTLSGTDLQWNPTNKKLSKFPNRTLHGLGGKYKEIQCFLPKWGGLRWGNMENKVQQKTVFVQFGLANFRPIKIGKGWIASGFHPRNDEKCFWLNWTIIYKNPIRKAWNLYGWGFLNGGGGGIRSCSLAFNGNSVFWLRDFITCQKHSSLSSLAQPT